MYEYTIHVPLHHTHTHTHTYQDLLGLQSLSSTGRLHFLGAPFDHLQFTDEWFNEYLMPYVNVKMEDAHKPIAPHKS